MAKPLSNDLRSRLIDYVQGGLSARSAGRKLSISASAATVIVKRWRTTGSYILYSMFHYPFFQCSSFQ